MARSLEDKVVLVTGASAGIGEALARAASGRGARVIAIARRSERVEALASELWKAGPKALGFGCDVTSRAQIDAVVQEAVAAFDGIDMVFANAGFGVEGKFESLTVEDYRRQFDTNVFGVLDTLYATLPHLKAARGAVGVVGSANGYINAPGWSAYCMSKYALRSLCACIRPELKAQGVSVTHLAPGFVESDLRKVSNHNRLEPEALDPVPAWLPMPAATAAEKMLDAVLARRAEAVIALHAKLAVAAARYVPCVVSAVTDSERIVRSLSKDAG